MDNRGISTHTLSLINSDQFKNNPLTNISHNILFSVSSPLSAQQVSFLNLHKITSGENFCYVNSLIPAMIFYFKNEKEVPLDGLVLSLKKNKTIASCSFSTITFKEPHLTDQGCAEILDQEKLFSFSIKLPREFFLENSFIGISSFASGFNPNFFEPTFTPIRTGATNNDRFKIYKEFKSLNTLLPDLLIYPWGFKYKCFSSWNHNLRCLAPLFVNRKISTSKSTLLSVFPQAAIKEIKVD